MSRTTLLILIFVWLGTYSIADARSTGRFFMEGDGKISLRNLRSGQRAVILYRDENGTYPLDAYQKLNKLFGLSKGESVKGISLRLVSLLDYIQDHWGHGTQVIQLVSTYRSPRYNRGLRDQGKTVAVASLHMEGMAADIKIAGMPGKQLWEALRAKDCCGVGWYGGASVHVDPGPARFWTGATSKVHTNISDHNKKIILRTDRDIYFQEETVSLTLGRVTEFPFGVSKKLKLVSITPEEEKGILEFTPDFQSLKRDQCFIVNNRVEARQISWRIPKRRKPFPKRSAVRVSFCNRPHADMPDSILSNPIEILSH